MHLAHTDEEVYEIASCILLQNLQWFRFAFSKKENTNKKLEGFLMFEAKILYMIF